MNFGSFYNLRTAVDLFAPMLLNPSEKVNKLHESTNSKRYIYDESKFYVYRIQSKFKVTE